MRIRAVNTCSFVFDSVPDRYKTQGMCDKAFDDNPSTIKYLPDRYKTHEMCDKAIDDDPHALEFVPDRYKTKKCVIKLLMIILLH